MIQGRMCTLSFETALEQWRRGNMPQYVRIPLDWPFYPVLHYDGVMKYRLVGRTETGESVYELEEYEAW